MFSSGSKVKFTVDAGISDSQVPSNSLFCFPEVVQLNDALLAMLTNAKDGPVSKRGVLVEPGAREAGGI